MHPPCVQESLSHLTWCIPTAPVYALPYTILYECGYVVVSKELAGDCSNVLFVTAMLAMRHGFSVRFPGLKNVFIKHYSMSGLDMRYCSTTTIKSLDLYCVDTIFRRLFCYRFFGRTRKFLGHSHSVIYSLRPSDTYIYMRQWTNHHWFRWWLVACSVPCLYLNQELSLIWPIATDNQLMTENHHLK